MTDKYPKVCGTFNNIREAHSHYEYRGSFAHLVVYDDAGVTRIYDNSSNRNSIDKKD